MGVALGIGILLVFGIIMLIAIAAAVITIIGRWKVFEKAGKPGWAAIVPYYNSWVTYELGDFPPLLILLEIGMSIVSGGLEITSSLMEYNEAFAILVIVLSITSILCSVAVTIIQVIVHINIAKKFGKSSLYGVGLALVPCVFYLMLGLDKNAVYTETQKNS